MMQRKTVKHEPLLHISKRMDVSQAKAWGIRFAAIVLAMLVCALISTIYTKSFGGFFTSMWKGSFDIDFSKGLTNRLWTTLSKTAILLCIALALVPAFKMKFWNIGAEGQTLIGCLICGVCMFYIKNKVSNSILLILMLVLSVAAGIIWAVIPAIFKAKWNTNETLFTLMMNYIAKCLVAFFISYAVKTGSGVLGLLPFGHLPYLNIPGLSASGTKYILIVGVVIVLTVVMYVYLKYSKHGYELTVVGESYNTARYVGINVKSVIIRTMILSGAICGFAGWLLTTGSSYTVNADSVGGDGFTAILVAWLSQFNPFIMMITAFMVIFLKVGAKQISTDFGLNNNYFGEVIVGIFFFFIIGCEFFINYRIQFRKKEKPVLAETDNAVSESEQVGEENAEEMIEEPEKEENVQTQTTENTVEGE